MRIKLIAAVFVLFVACGGFGVSGGLLSTSFTVTQVPEDATHIRTRVFSEDGTVNKVQSKQITSDSTDFTYTLNSSNTYNIGIVSYNDSTRQIKSFGEEGPIDVLPTTVETIEASTGQYQVDSWSFNQQNNYKFSLSLTPPNINPDHFFGSRTVQFGSSSLEYEKPLSDSLEANLTEIEGDTISTLHIKTRHTLLSGWSQNGDSLRLDIPEDSTWTEDLEGTVEIIVSDCAVKVNNATIHFPASSAPSYVGAGDTLATVTPDGTCAGYQTWTEGEGATLAAAGSDTLDLDKNGFQNGEQIKLAVKDSDTKETYVQTPSMKSCSAVNLPAALCKDDGIYEDDTFQQIASLE